MATSLRPSRRFEIGGGNIFRDAFQQNRPLSCAPNPSASSGGAESCGRFRTRALVRRSSSIRRWCCGFAARCFLQLGTARRVQLVVNVGTQLRFDDFLILRHVQINSYNLSFKLQPEQAASASRYARSSSRRASRRETAGFSMFPAATRATRPSADSRNLRYPASPARHDIPRRAGPEQREPLHLARAARPVPKAAGRRRQDDRPAPVPDPLRGLALRRSGPDDPARRHGVSAPSATG